MHDITGLGGPDQYIRAKNVVCRSAEHSLSCSLTWAHGMLQVFVAGFVSKMMERIIAEQRVAAEHQRQIRELQYVSQTVIPPKHGLEVLVLPVGMVDSPQQLLHGCVTSVHYTHLALQKMSFRRFRHAVNMHFADRRHYSQPSAVDRFPLYGGTSFKITEVASLQLQAAL